jgi:GrpB-like predicted nucleotidyltransferase (UPF0157 family)
MVIRLSYREAPNAHCVLMLTLQHNCTSHLAQRHDQMDEIYIVEYDPRWPALYEAEGARVREALGEMVQRIEHIGSTAVPGLDAKPIIDIQLAVESVDEAQRLAVAPLEAIGYTYWAFRSHGEHLVLVRGLPPNGPRTHHLHIVSVESADWECVLFRDYLRAHPDEAARYTALKRDLAVRFRADREAYTAGKTEFVQRITALAKQSYQP